MKVKASPINTTAGTIFVLKTADTKNRVLHNAPNKWKTKRGAEKWASENGFNVQQATKKPSTRKPTRSTTTAAAAKNCSAKKPAAVKSVRKTVTARKPAKKR